MYICVYIPAHWAQKHTSNNKIKLKIVFEMSLVSMSETEAPYFHSPNWFSFSLHSKSNLRTIQIVCQVRENRKNRNVRNEFSTQKNKKRTRQHIYKTVLDRFIAFLRKNIHTCTNNGAKEEKKMFDENNDRSISETEKHSPKSYSVRISAKTQNSLNLKMY